MSKLQITSDDVCFYVTEACNSNCIMCPMSQYSRKRADFWSHEDWLQAIEEIPTDAEHITITGGEPLLHTEDLKMAMESINRKVPDASVLILTNGRILSIKKIQEELRPLLSSRYRIAIPIHASSSDLHDKITQSNGSFKQSMSALRFLSSTDVQIEVRIVAHKLNIHDLTNTYKMLVDSRIRINYINLIAMEMTGCAAFNRNLLWIPYSQAYNQSREGIQYAAAAGIDIGLYNFPLCTLPQSAWPLACNSITSWKIRYPEECEMCTVKLACGGMFYSTYGLKLCPVKPYRR